MYNPTMLTGARPMNGFVYVQQRDPNRERKGLLMPTKLERPEIVMGTVLAVGENVENLHVGDTVLYDPFNHKTYGDPIVHVVPSFDVFAVLDTPAGEDFEISDLMGTVLGRRVYIEWLEAKDSIAGSSLLRSPKYSKAHYTGIVVGLGDDLYGPDLDELKIGDRVFFQQFSDFKYWYEPGGKRFAIIPHHGILAILPDRETELTNEAYIGVEA
ncbi:MAG: hypothetical protein EKK55_17355 [Rhodocyclaceae bacterium]|nr:MAG: hypothetical protein EKK55_17355 [Rhodocyclaceae bacterium]